MSDNVRVHMFEWPLNIGSTMAIESTVDLGVNGGHLCAARCELDATLSSHPFELRMTPATIARVVAMRARRVAGPKNQANDLFRPFPFLHSVSIEVSPGGELVVLRGVRDLEIVR